MAVAVPTAAEAPAEDSLSLGGVSARKALLLVATAVLLVVSVVLLAPAFADLPDAWERIRNGDMRWLTLALAFEVLSFLGHIVLFSARRRGRRLGLAHRPAGPAPRSTSPATPRRACSPAPAPAASR